MTKNLYVLWSLLGLMFVTTSCSTYDKVAVWYKYRGEYRVHPVATDRLASNGKGKALEQNAAPAAVTASQQPEATTEVALASAGQTAQVEAQAARPEAVALAAALSKTQPSAAAEHLTTAPTKAGKVTLRQAFKMRKAFKAMAASAPKEGKSQLVALLLVIFVGGLGIHRFYLGYIWQGVVQLLTLGGCGIWALIDLIRIITGDLQPKGSTYTQTL